MSLFGQREREIDAESQRIIDESSKVLQENATLWSRQHEVDAKLAEATTFSEAHAELFEEFTELLDRTAYIDLSDEAKAIWYPIFKEAIQDLLGDEFDDDAIQQEMDTSTFRHLLECTAQLSPATQGRIDTLVHEIMQQAQESAHDTAVQRIVENAKYDANRQAPSLANRVFEALMESPEGQKIYDEWFKKALAEHQSHDPEELARKIGHEAYLAAAEAYLDRKTTAMEQRMLLEEARETFRAPGIDLSKLPTGTRLTIWLGDQPELNIWQKHGDYIVYRRKIMAYTTGDKFGGLEIYSDQTNTPGENHAADFSLDSVRQLKDLPTQVANSIRMGMLSTEPQNGVTLDDTTKLDGRHVIGWSRKGYTGDANELSKYVMAGKGLAYDGDPTNPEHKSTTMMVLNVAINDEEVWCPKEHIPYEVLNQRFVTRYGRPLPHYQ